MSLIRFFLGSIPDKFQFTGIAAGRIDGAVDVETVFGPFAHNLADIAEYGLDRSGIERHVVAIILEAALFRDLNCAVHPAFMLADPDARRIISPGAIGRTAPDADSLVASDMRLIILAFQLIEESGPNLLQIQFFHHPLFFFRQLKRRHPKQPFFDSPQQILVGLDVAEAFQKCLVVLVEVRLGFDKDGARQIVETGQRTVDQIFRKRILQKKPFVESNGDSTSLQ